MSKVVARYNINSWGPPPEIVIEGTPGQRIKKDEAFQVTFPPIFNRSGEPMPRITFNIEVRKREDEGNINDFVFLAQSNLQNYKNFWEDRKVEAQTGIFLP